jgi:hypothetical protein
LIGPDAAPDRRLRRRDAGRLHRPLTGFRRDAVDQHGHLLRRVVAPLELKTHPIVGPFVGLPGNQHIVRVGISLDTDRHHALRALDFNTHTRRVERVAAAQSVIVAQLKGAHQ